MAGYGSFSTLVNDAKREALIAEMTCNGWDFRDERYFEKRQNYGESFSQQAVTLDGQASAASYAGGVSNDNDELLAQAALDEFNKVKGKWESQINSLVTGFDNLPDPGGFDAAIASAQEAARKVAAGTGNSNSELGNPDLTDMGFIRDRLPTNIGQTVDMFYRLYGPDRLELVLDGYCEVMGCLGTALAGRAEGLEQRSGGRGGDPDRRHQGFQGHQAEQQHRLERHPHHRYRDRRPAQRVHRRSARPRPGAGRGQRQRQLPAVRHVGAEEVRDDSHSRLQGLAPRPRLQRPQVGVQAAEPEITTQETQLKQMCQSMLGSVNAAGNRENFHIGPDVGLDKGYAGSDDIIDMKYSILKTIGYECMPQIANAFCQSADAGMAAVDKGPWSRYYSSVVGDWIGLDFYGFYYEWEDLIYRVQPLMNDTAAEVVAAGVKLAVAAGYVQDTDGSVQAALGDNYKDIKDAKLGWNNDSYKPPPPPPPPRHTGGHALI